MPIKSDSSYFFSQSIGDHNFDLLSTVFFLVSRMEEYNNVNYDTEFYGNVIVNYIDHNISSDNLDLYFKKDFFLFLKKKKLNFNLLLALLFGVLMQQKYIYQSVVFSCLQIILGFRDVYLWQSKHPNILKHQDSR